MRSGFASGKLTPKYDSIAAQGKVTVVHDMPMHVIL